MSYMKNKVPTERKAELNTPLGKIVIRKFIPSDLEAVIKINRSCLPENYPPYFFMQHYREFPEAFLVAELNGEVVGYVMCRVEYGISNLKPSLSKKGHIISIAVVPEVRRKKVGETLMKLAMQALRDIYNVSEYYLEVRVSNTPAINLYHKLGYKEIKRIIGYYLDGEDAWLMARPA